MTNCATYEIWLPYPSIQQNYSAFQSKNKKYQSQLVWQCYHVAKYDLLYSIIHDNIMLAIWFLISWITKPQNRALFFYLENFVISVAK